ncbi:MAG TPA: hypothetical protein VG733_00565, partial [Chthoniobacteraceae bacterium]|nr:hypothetical protein [Chthoniobacteraceae bacterium]
MEANETLGFCPPLASMLQAGEVAGRSGNVRKISSVSTLNNLVVLHNLFMEMKPERTLEIGFAHGGSALLFTICQRDAGRQPCGQHTAI